jgi:hypothetical protein
MPSPEFQRPPLSDCRSGVSDSIRVDLNAGLTEHYVDRAVDSEAIRVAGPLGAMPREAILMKPARRFGD